MAFNPSSDSEKRASMDPKDLRFTQPDIKATFTDPTYPSLEEAVSLIRKGELDQAVLGELTVYTDEQGVVWCQNNRRLYVLRKAGVPSVRVKFIKNGFMFNKLKETDKTKLNDPAFVPRIRGETSGVQIPPPSTSGASFDQEQKGTSLLGIVGAVSAVAAAGYWGWKLFNSQPENREDNDDDRNN